MIKDDDIVYWVWLSQILGAGHADVEYILSKFDSPQDLYNFSKSANFDKVRFLSTYLISKMKSTSIDVAIKIVERCREKGYEIVTIKDDQYPFRLKNIYSCPTLLYVSGNMGDIDNTLAISIVGARKCSEYAKSVTKIFAKQLALSGVTIISGMAVGVDGIALEEALNNDGRVISVLGCGLDIDYPLKNLNLKKAIESSIKGCIISEYPPDTRPLAANFPIRNRIMAGLSVGVLVVEASLRSGSLITAKIATDQGKDVYGVPNNIFFENNFGAMNLLKEGANIVTCPEDIINQYRWQYNVNSVHLKTTLQSKINKISFDSNNFLPDETDNVNITIDKRNKDDYNLDGNLKRIFDLLLVEGQLSVDYISNKLNLPVNEVLIIITELELRGYIKNCPGMKYEVK